jgi:hypothetical protein
MKTEKLLLFYCFWLLPLTVFGAPDTVRFVNAGKMAVAANGATGKSVLHIPHAVWMTQNASIRQDGITTIGGNFYQNAVTNVFYKSGGNFPSTGKIVFFRDNGVSNTGTRRYVTVNKFGNIDAFDRGQSFVAFPEIEIRTKDTLVIPARMGIDALKLTRNTASYGSTLASSCWNPNPFPGSLTTLRSGSPARRILLPPSWFRRVP